jgi:hypothetical protein
MRALPGMRRRPANYLLHKWGYFVLSWACVHSALMRGLESGLAVLEHSPSWPSHGPGPFMIALFTACRRGRSSGPSAHRCVLGPCPSAPPGDSCGGPLGLSPPWPRVSGALSARCSASRRAKHLQPLRPPGRAFGPSATGACPLGLSFASFAPSVPLSSRWSLLCAPLVQFVCDY